MQNDSSELSFCPSFSSYSSDNRLLDIAASVSRDSKEDGVSDDEEFEFVNNLWESPKTWSFPIFSRDLGDGDDDDMEEAIRIPLRNLYIGDGDLRSSSSSSEVDELEGVPEGTYCVWKPKQSAESSPNRCKKSKSSGSSSSKRWRFIKELLKRSKSDSKVSPSSFSFLNFDKNKTGKKNEEKASQKTATTTTTEKKKREGEMVQAKNMSRVQKVSAHEIFYVRNKTLKEADKRRSYLPYRQDLFGVFANVNGLGRTFLISKKIP